MASIYRPAVASIARRIERTVSVSPKPKSPKPTDRRKRTVCLVPPTENGPFHTPRPSAAPRGGGAERPLSAGTGDQRQTTDQDAAGIPHGTLTRETLKSRHPCVPVLPCNAPDIRARDPHARRNSGTIPKTYSGITANALGTPGGDRY